MADDPAVLRQRAAEMLADAEQSLAELTQMRAERERASPEPLKPVARIPEPPEMSTRHMSNWDATQTWVEKIIDQRTGAAAKAWVSKQLEEFAGGLGDDMAKFDKKERERVGREIKAAVDAAKAELRAEFQLAIAEARIAALETRLAEAERRAAPPAKPEPPRLIGHSDAAD